MEKQINKLKRMWEIKMEIPLMLFKKSSGEFSSNAILTTVPLKTEAIKIPSRKLKRLLLSGSIVEIMKGSSSKGSFILISFNA